MTIRKTISLRRNRGLRGPRGSKRPCVKSIGPGISLPRSLRFAVATRIVQGRHEADCIALARAKRSEDEAALFLGAGEPSYHQRVWLEYNRIWETASRLCVRSGSVQCRNARLIALAEQSVAVFFRPG